MRVNPHPATAVTAGTPSKWPGQPRGRGSMAIRRRPPLSARRAQFPIPTYLTLRRQDPSARRSLRVTVDRSQTPNLGSSSGQYALGRITVQLGRPPAVPGCHGSIGTKWFAQWLQLALGRHRDPPGQPVPPPNAQVAGRPDIESTQLEQQEHLRGPPADATDRAQPGRDLIVGLAGQPPRLEDDRAV